MRNDTSQLIERLSSDLAPIKPLAHPAVRCGLWMILATGTSVGLLAIGGIGSSGADSHHIAELINQPRFLLEQVVGYGSAAVAAFFALGISVGFHFSMRQKLLGLAPTAIFTALLVTQSLSPAIPHEHEMLRLGCAAEVLAVGLIPWALLLAFVRKGFLFDRQWLGSFMVLAAFMPVVVGLQFTCRAEPTHGLFFHLVPVLLLALAVRKIADRLLA